MDLTALTRYLNLRSKRTLYIALTAPILTYYLSRLLSTAFSPRSQSSPHILASPLRPLHQYPNPAQDSLPYPPDALPGARDVETPYGSIRVYEWGPPAGRKVLFVHGISTPCIAFAGMAKLLVEREGCRVMLFDLFGRGYSDTPNPVAFPQDVRLFTTQILLVLASSELGWMGAGERFTLVGYSRGVGLERRLRRIFRSLLGRWC